VRGSETDKSRDPYHRVCSLGENGPVSLTPHYYSNSLQCGFARLCWNMIVPTNGPLVAFSSSGFLITGPHPQPLRLELAHGAARPPRPRSRPVCACRPASTHLRFRRRMYRCAVSVAGSPARSSFVSDTCFPILIEPFRAAGSSGWSIQTGDRAIRPDSRRAYPLMRREWPQRLCRCEASGAGKRRTATPQRCGGNCFAARELP